MKLNLLFSLITLVSLLILISPQASTLSMLNEVMEMRMFYNELITKYKIADKVEVVIDDFEIYLKSKKPFTKMESIMGVETKYFFTSCDFFPFMEVIIKALKEYAVNRVTDPEQFIVSYTLIYNILFLQLGDKNKAYRYYKDKFNLKKLKPNSFIKFDVDQDVQKYLYSLPHYTIKTSLNLSKEERALAESFGINLNYKTKTLEIFQYVIDYVIRNTKSEVQLAMKSFINNDVSFYSLVGLLNSKKFFFSEESYRMMLLQPGEDEYEKYKELIYPEDYRPKMCKIIAPLLDLVQLEVPKSNSFKEKVEINFSRENVNFIGFISDSVLESGEVITSHNHDRINNEYHFVSTGKIPIENIYDFVSFQFLMKKSEMNEQQVLFCQSIGCAGIDIISFWSNNKIKEAQFSFTINPDNINEDIIRVLKIFNIKQIPESIAPFIKLNLPFNHNVEAKALVSYYNILQDFKKNKDLEKIIDDYKEILIAKDNRHNLELEKYLLSFGKRIRTNEDNIRHRQLDTILSIDPDVEEKIYRLFIQKLRIVNFNLTKNLEMIQKNSLDDIRKLAKNKYY